LRLGLRSTSQSVILMASDQKGKTQKRFPHGANDEKRRAKLRSKPRKMQREGSMKNKVMVEVGDLENLKAAIKVYEDWYPTDNIRTLVELAKRVVAEEEKIRDYIEFPVDIDSY
jgi:hypothetical protein